MPNQVYSYSSASHQNIIVLNFPGLHCVKDTERENSRVRKLWGESSKKTLSLEPSPICVGRLWREYCLLGGFKNSSVLTYRK